MKKLILIGNLGADAKVNSVNGKVAINFSIAENETYTDKAGVKQEITTWFNCAIWKNDGNSRLPEFLKKGTQVYVEGNINTRLFQGQNNQMQISNDVNVNFIQLLGSPKTEAAPAPAPQQQPAQQPAPQPAAQPQAAQAPEPVFTQPEAMQPNNNFQ